MALGVYFAIDGMTPEKYRTVHERLDAIGQGAPAGRSFHAGFHVGDGLHVFDVWESEEAFGAFGEHLMPILGELGVDPGQPRIGEIERVISG